ncbi:MAG: hypothetical protein JJU05_02795 [Verrucomicrobia bacterium]|nr:hypothetical protein [Verrucomicrobiota bacterium]MCH8527672.1 hypothetical protein [Kiritimatiellia bacterium]
MNLSVEDIAFIQEGRVETFAVSRSRTSEWMTFRGTHPLYFFRASTLENLEEEEPLPRPLAQFSPPDSGAWLLIFVQNPEEGDGPKYRIFPIPDTEETVEEGLRFFNLTGMSLLVNVNDETIRLASGSQSQMNPEPEENASMFLRIARVENGDVELLSSTVFGHRPGARISYFLLLNNRGRIQLQRFIDSVGPAREPVEE